MPTPGWNRDGAGRRRTGGRPRYPPGTGNSFWKRLGPRKAFQLIIISLAFVALLPPLFFHFKLRRFNQMRTRKCGWINNPPLVCAHGGDSTDAFPNTMEAYRSAIRAQVDCIEIDISRSADGVLFALHDRELQRISGNSSLRVGHLNVKEIQQLGRLHQSTLKFRDLGIPTIEEALQLISSSVRQVILDAKVGPPLHEKGLAKDILSIVRTAECHNCLVWAKSDTLARDVLKLSPEAMVGYIVMVDPKTGQRTNLLRMKGAKVVGVYHQLIDEKLVRILHGRNKSVYAWTVDDEDSMSNALFERIDAVVTNKPNTLQRLMQDIRAQCREGGISFPH